MSENSIAVIVTYCARDARYMKRCLASIAWQLESSDDLVVVYDGDDGAGSCMWESIKQELQRIDDEIYGASARLGKAVNWYSSMKGVSRARNVGASHTRAQWLKFMDVDDVLAPFALNAIRRSNLPNQCKVVRGAQTTIWNGRFNGEFVPSSRNGFLREEAILLFRPWEGMMRQNPATVSQTFIDRVVFETAGGFQEKIEFEEDWELWLRVHKLFGPSAFGGIRDRICYYWISDDERAKKRLNHQVDGMDSREYLRREYGAVPDGT
jgi:glycosyltransferase involved in cell wall biosynthesis